MVQMIYPSRTVRYQGVGINHHFYLSSFWLPKLWITDFIDFLIINMLIYSCCCLVLRFFRFATKRSRFYTHLGQSDIKELEFIITFINRLFDCQHLWITNDLIDFLIMNCFSLLSDKILYFASTRSRFYLGQSDIKEY